MGAKVVLSDFTSKHSQISHNLLRCKELIKNSFFWILFFLHCDKVFWNHSSERSLNQGLKFLLVKGRSGAFKMLGRAIDCRVCKRWNQRQAETLQCCKLWKESLFLHCNSWTRCSLAVSVCKGTSFHDSSLWCIKEQRKEERQSRFPERYAKNIKLKENERKLVVSYFHLCWSGCRRFFIAEQRK